MIILCLLEGDWMRTTLVLDDCPLRYWENITQKKGSVTHFAVQLTAKALAIFLQSKMTLMTDFVAEVI
jgi:hypothetical protein